MKEPPCPLCGEAIEPGEVTWPVTLSNGSLADGGCQGCWDEQTDAEWWKQVKAMDTILAEMKKKPSDNINP